ncbi:MAG: alanine racemase, partial [Rubrobacteridae bacterium]|nr:alanine racemase [Rubrobacteridae bacterium]
PMLWEVPQVVALTDVCLVSEIDTVRAISHEVAGCPSNLQNKSCLTANNPKSKYSIIVMIELGDLREGIMPDKLNEFIEAALSLPGIEVAGIGANVACLQGISPTPVMLERLVGMAEAVRTRYSIEMPLVSGGNSSAWKLLETGVLPKGVNQLRFGEAILLGQETTNLDPISGAYRDAFVLEAEIIELKDKPVSDGGIKRYERRAILALGSQDICGGELHPFDTGARIQKRSSDHLVVDISNSNFEYRVGDSVGFIPSYEALLGAMTSPFVEKAFLCGHV